MRCAPATRSATGCASRPRRTGLRGAWGRALFGGEAARVRFDMSEYGEPHAAARLVGAPPGYLGHDAGGQLTGAVRPRPFRVLLLDEIDKAHPSATGPLLQVL